MGGIPRCETKQENSREKFVGKRRKRVLDETTLHLKDDGENDGEDEVCVRAWVGAFVFSTSLSSRASSNGSRVFGAHLFIHTLD